MSATPGPSMKMDFKKYHSRYSKMKGSSVNKAAQHRPFG